MASGRSSTRRGADQIGRAASSRGCGTPSVYDNYEAWKKRSDMESGGAYTVGDFMTKREELHVVKQTTSVDEALERLVEHRITGFPVIDDDWNLVGNAIILL
ncbi:CBS domain-containing protein CBSX1, chloroplastic-like [Lolium rigidum]|uniref:CBS domain-containing protein CBSX1, chloroplastic-like n=1 Tax=Lolium rigidum TaxID=89674 RepID=UPI001F5CB9E9|nr:CBS domain-containing protein CBSX1, chloroplastic-like [Lolium rigidum]